MKFLCVPRIPVRYIPIFLIVFLSFRSAPANAERIGSKWTAPPAFRALKPLGAIEFFGLPDSTITGSFKGCQLFKDPVKGWLLIGTASGQVWTLNKDDRWERQDSTECVAYNSGAIVLPGPLKYGGFGIWRSFGLLLFYSWQAHEWHTIELSAEHPPNGGGGTPVYYDANDSALYQAGYQVRNDGIKKELTFVDSVYRLDLKTGEWQTLGRLNPEIPTDYKIASGEGTIVNAPEGVLFFSYGIRKPLYINLKKQHCYQLSDRVSDRLWILNGSQYSKNKHAVATETGIYSFNSAYELLDSASWKELLSDVLQEYPLLEERPALPFHPTLAIVGGVLLAALSVIGYRRYQRKPAAPPHPISATAPQPKDAVDPVPLTVNPTNFLLEELAGTFVFAGRPLVELYDQETQLLNLLIRKRKVGETLSIQQINEVLGIEQRTIDSQKKIRSEIIRSINRHFNACGFPGEAVQRSRQEDDRRSVTYVLAAEIEVGGVRV